MGLLFPNPTIGGNTGRFYTDTSGIPATLYPCSFGFWLNLPTNAAASLFGVADGLLNAATQDRIMVQSNGASGWALFSKAAGTENNTNLSGTIVAGGWHYYLLRCITITNRRLDILNPNGSVSSIQDTTSRTMTTIARMEIADRAMSVQTSPAKGTYAEFWYALDNVLGNTGAMSPAVMRQLAYGGPFSIPQLLPSLMEYRSFRQGAFGGGMRHTWSKGRKPWTYQLGTGNVKSVLPGIHPPLPVNPNDRKLFVSF